MKHLLAALLCLSLAAPAAAKRVDDEVRDFVAANLIAIFYHELGHALIDILKLPIYGQEEDAAVRVAYATAFGFLGDVKYREDSGGEIAYWDVHGPDLQRFYTFVCLFYGGNPSGRQAVADDLELPRARQETCPEEFQQASSSWGLVIDELEAAGAGKSIRFLSDHRVGVFGLLSADVLKDEVEAMNAALSLPKRLLVRVEPCNTVNAFYDPKTREIIMCTEFAEYLAEMDVN